MLLSSARTSNNVEIDETIDNTFFTAILRPDSEAELFVS